MTRIVGVMILAASVVHAAKAPVAPSPQFDVASVKPASLRLQRPMENHEEWTWKTRMRFSERVFARDAPLRGLIQMAHAVWGDQIEGLPGWADSARYEIEPRARGWVGQGDPQCAHVCASLANCFSVGAERTTVVQSDQCRRGVDPSSFYVRAWSLPWPLLPRAPLNPRPSRRPRRRPGSAQRKANSAQRQANSA